MQGQKKLWMLLFTIGAVIGFSRIFKTKVSLENGAQQKLDLQDRIKVEQPSNSNYKNL